LRVSWKKLLFSFSYLFNSSKACWNGEPPRYYVGYETTIDAPKLLIPPITFTAIPGNEKDGSGAGFRLMMDFFKNDWLIPQKKQLRRKILVPNMEGLGDYAWRKDVNYESACDWLNSLSEEEEAEWEEIPSAIEEDR
jgi:hypothetical protein